MMAAGEDVFCWTRVPYLIFFFSELRIGMREINAAVQAAKINTRPTISRNLEETVQRRTHCSARATGNSWALYMFRQVAQDSLRMISSRSSPSRKEAFRVKIVAFDTLVR